MSPEFLQRISPFFFALPVLWIAGWVVASIYYRRAHGKPILAFGVPDATFVETTASGASNRTWVTKMGGASGCLIVAVAKGRLVIRPRFPFNLVFLPEIYGLEYDVPVEYVTKVDFDAARPTRVRLEFRDSTNSLQDVSLRLRDGQAFVSALKARVR